MKKIIGLLFIVLTMGFGESSYWIQALSVQDTKTHISLLEKGVEQNETQSIQFLGQLYQIGSKSKGVKKDLQKAIKVYLKGSELEDTTSMSRLGALYALIAESSKKKIDKIDNYTKSIYFYQKAIDKDPKVDSYRYKDSVHSLIRLYYNYHTVEYYTKVAELYKASPDFNNSIITFKVGILYEKGNGVTQNYKKAFALYKKAADDGLPEACVNLANLYVNGYGVKQDKIKAYQYWRKGIKKGATKGQQSLDKLCKESPWACKE